ncbi:MAG: glycosyltransferase [Bacteroidota bacterium]
MVLPVSITLLLASLYSMVMILLSWGLGRLRKNQTLSQDDPVSVTVIIPFRNEKERLPDLVRDLARQSYPKDHVNVIFVNDHSQDGSKESLKLLIGNNSRFICLDLPGDKSGKKEALSLAVQHAKSEWIIQTDADCRVGPQFIASHMAFREKHNSDMVAGLVTTREGAGGLLEYFERLDLLSLVGAGAGSFHFNMPLMCNGANLAYSRKLFHETRPYDPAGKLASGDDMFLMIGAWKLGKSLSYNASREGMVQTLPVRNLGELIAQRIRWGSKTVHYRTPHIQSVGLLVAITNFLILLIPVSLFLAPGYWHWLLLAFIIKTLGDFWILYRVTGLSGQRKSLRAFLPVSIVYYLFQMVITAGSLFMPPVWKGRQY